MVTKATKPSCSYLPILDELDRLVARAFDHHRAVVADFVRLLEEAHVLRA